MPSEGLRNRIKRVNTALKRLSALSKYNESEFFSDFRNIDSAERNLHVAIEGLLDIGNFIIANLSLEAPDTYKDVGKILALNKIVPTEIGNLLTEMAKFRNILVHGYAIVSDEKIYELLKTKLNDLTSVFSALIEALDAHEIDLSEPINH
ncbi:MAG: DUF86 domain-containing protein [Candidatus Odinarchaeota archaeon]|nr:DUF86 domain-containing protein [Candidatus Odinarchaeota archaeon]